MNLDHIIGPLKEDIERHERLKKLPPPTAEEMEEQLRASREYRRSKEYQEMRTKEGWAKFVASWRKQRGL